MFVRYISHEMRNPLNSIFMGLELIKHELLSTDTPQLENEQKICQILEDVTSACHKSVEVLDALLSMEKIDLGEDDTGTRCCWCYCRITRYKILSSYEVLHIQILVVNPN